MGFPLFALLPVRLSNGKWLWLEWCHYKNYHSWGGSWTSRWQTPEQARGRKVEIPRLKKDSP